MTTASAPATSSERRDPFFQNTKNRLASLSSKNDEILDEINRLQHSHSQTLNVINSQLDTLPHANGSVDNLVNNLKSRQRRSSNSQQQSISSVLKSDKLNNGKDLGDVMEVEVDYKINEPRTITTDDSLSSRKSAKLAMANRNVKEIKNLSPNNNNEEELDRKYFSANYSDSEDDNEDLNMEDKDFDNNSSSTRRRIHKGYPTLTINTSTTKSSRLITPESSDSEFDISNAHMPLAPTLGGGRNPLRAARHSSAELYNGHIERRGRAANSLFSSVGDVIEEERSVLSDVTEQNEVNSSDSINIDHTRGKQITSTNGTNGRKRAQKYLDDYSVANDVPKAIKIHRRPLTDDSYADVPDDNSSVMSTDSYLQLEELRARVQKLEAERIDDENMSERKGQRRKKNYSDSIISPAALSPDSSQGGASSITSIPRQSSVSAQHQKHLQNSFDMFEKAFTTDHPANDSLPPPSHSMAMVVSSALSLNQKLRSVMAQMESDGQISERGLKTLLKTSDEQVRSLTECLIALIPLAPKRVTKKISGERDQFGIRGYQYPNDSSLLQMPTPSNSTRSISPIPRISSVPVLPHDSQIGEHVDHQPSSRRVSPNPPSDQSSPPNSYYIPSRNSSRYSRISRSSSPTLPPDDPQASRVFDYRERKSRRSSGTSYSSYSGTNPPSPPLTQHLPSNYDQLGSRAYYEREVPRELPRELPRLQRHSIQGYNNISSQPTTSAYQKTTSRPSSFIRNDEVSYPHNHHAHHARTSSISSSTSSVHRSSSGRYARVTNEEYVNSPVSTTRSQPPFRSYEYIRRYPSDGQTPIDRRPTPGLDMDRRYSRRIVSQYETEDGYDGSNGYGENIPERDYIRDDKAGIRRSISNSSSIYKQRMVSAQEQEASCNVVGTGNEESRSESNQQSEEINHDNSQNNDVSNGKAENGEEENEYI